MYRNLLKRLFDFSVSLLGLVLLSPLLFLATFALFFSNRGKPFFFQKRPGKDGELFNIIKFKTMNDKSDTEGNLLPDSARVTKVGAFVRKTSIDEIPQLINVLKGEMSLVGPRPLLPDYLHLYNNFQKRRNLVRPGITGWAQVNGRNTISWDQKFKFDVWYVDNLNFKLDMKILLLTVKKVFCSEGITQEGHVTSDEFKGNFL
ncbi:sugar transferase [Kaistella sp. 97-N-M2]|uniref:sugar transferase n=1 Tax=Kaistella sp. 97-N-M2 TaxID=2908645 RepID=UPI001F3B4563|nr:sugar transferase [Kaistella sp. 97-N-M2]UJF28816.1 sugar transferase [Kaistella sp. 97-N-M2]